jgi:hypothetical protein
MLLAFSPMYQLTKSYRLSGISSTTVTHLQEAHLAEQSHPEIIGSLRTTYFQADGKVLQ